jgi:putative transposase
MARPVRNANPDRIQSSSRTFFVTTKTSMGRALLQSERNAMLLVDVLRTYAAARKFEVHDFVVMPDHVHLLITVHEDTTIERAVQSIKGGFSYRLRKEFGCEGEVWQRGFSEVRVNDVESYRRHREYIAQNPVKAGLVGSPEEFPFCFTSLTRQKAQGLKPHPRSRSIGTAEAVP